MVVGAFAEDVDHCESVGYCVPKGFGESSGCFVVAFIGTAGPGCQAGCFLVFFVESVEVAVERRCMHARMCVVRLCVM